jgi:hypothetical protein
MRVEQKCLKRILNQRFIKFGDILKNHYTSLKEINVSCSKLTGKYQPGCKKGIGHDVLSQLENENVLTI